MSSKTTVDACQYLCIMRIFLLLLVLASPLIAQNSSNLDSARKALMERDYGKGRRLLEEALSAGANGVELWLMMSAAAHGLRDYRLMVTAGDNLSRLEPSSYVGWLYLTLGYHGLDRLDSLIEPAQRFCALNQGECHRAGIDQLLESLSQDSVGRQDSLFSTENGSLKVFLPKSWTTRVEDDGKVFNWFVSHQPITKATDIFTEGMTVRWVRRLSSLFPELSNKKADTRFLVSFWDAYVNEAIVKEKPFFRESTPERMVKIGEWSGFVRVVTKQVLKDSYRLIMFDVILAREDEVLSMIIECPEFVWPAYSNRYIRAVESFVPPN